MTVKSLESDLIAEEMRRTNGNVSKVARLLGLDYYDLREKTREDAGISFPRAKEEAEPKDIRTLGRPGFERFVIAVKPRGGGWPAKYKRIIDSARKAFDAGTHDMFQTNNEGWVVQYCIPIQPPRAPTKFFANMGIA